MPFFAPLFAAIGSIFAAAGVTALQVTLFVGSLAYQSIRQRKLKDEADKRKQVNVAVDGEPFYPSVVYGRAKVAGGKVKHRLSSNYVFAAAASANTVRTPTSGFNYSLTGPTMSFFEEGSLGTFIYWDGNLVYSQSNRDNRSSYLRSRKLPNDIIISDGSTYLKGVVMSTSSVTETVRVGRDSTFDRLITTTRYSIARQRSVESSTFATGLGSSQSGSKNEFLYVQQAIALGGISRVVDIEVDDKNWNYEELDAQRIHVYLNGSTADPMATANGLLSTNTFTNTAYSSSVFKLNRDAYNYNGSPNMTFFVEGKKVRDISNASMRVVYGGAVLDRLTSVSLNDHRLLTAGTNFSYDQNLVETEIKGASFSSKGEYLYLVNSSNSTVHSWALATPWDIRTRLLPTTRSFTGTTAGLDNGVLGIKLDFNGENLYLLGSTRNVLIRYQLSTPWDISSATYLEEIPLSAMILGPLDFDFTEDGTEFYVLRSNQLIKIQLTQPFLLSGATRTGVLSLPAITTELNGASSLCVDADANQVIIADKTRDRLYYYPIPTRGLLSSIQVNTTNFLQLASGADPDLVVAIWPEQRYEVKESSEAYSNNPALVLLDYLTSPVVGRGLNYNQVDLTSFLKARDICNRVVKSNAAIDGRIWGRRPDVEEEDGTITVQPAVAPRNIPLYECNVVIDTERTIRENIELILESMSEAELIWINGTYKLMLEDPQTLIAQQALAVITITDDNILSEGIDISWPDSSTRYNQVTARFKSEHENFVDDTITWPTTFDSVHNVYMEEDSNQPLKADVYLPCTTDPYHARAKAEQMVRFSRRAAVFKFKIDKTGLLLEPGDIINFSSASYNIDSENLKIQSVKLSENFTAEIEAVQYDYNTFAWNVADDVAYKDKLVYVYRLRPPTSPVFVSSNTGVLGVASGVLTWTSPLDTAVSEFVIEVSNDAGVTFRTLGTTLATEFSVPGLDTDTYVFAVRSRSPMGRMSTRAVTAAVDLVILPVNVLDANGNVVFGVNGQIGPTAFVTTSSGAVIDLSVVAANSLVPSINFVGEFSIPPTEVSLGAAWKQNAVYKNSTDGRSYILTGSPLAWMVYLIDGNLFYNVVESTNGNIFRPGAASSTLLKCRFFKNGAEVTDITPSSWFRWRRVSVIPGAIPNDATWNSSYSTGYKEISITVDSVNSRATFFCDLIAP